jgi:hypothetical protein
MKNWLTLVFLLLFCPLSAQTVYQDRVFDENILSARLFPRSGDFSEQFNTPVIELNSGIQLQLSFDDLAYDPDLYSVKLIHCTKDWTPSDLKEPEYLNQFNEFNVLDYNYSIDTRIPYVHYNFIVPPVTKSGNYVLVMYRGRDINQTVLTKRFMVFQKTLGVAARIVPPSQNENRREVQQINVSVNFKGRDLFDPLQNVRVVIRQNQQWDTKKILKQPTMIREDTKMMEFNLFDGSNVFWAGNEFRFIDLRFVRARGVNVRAIRMESDVVYAEAGLDKIRANTVYNEYLDVNGQFAIMNLERRNYDLESEYIVTTFNLSAEGVTDTPYVVGAFTNWGKDSAAKMELNKLTNTYQTTILMKQGWYDYVYGYPGNEGFQSRLLEGSYFETENEYEIFVYYRDMGSRYDELIGYYQLNPNKRRL